MSKMCETIITRQEVISANDPYWTETIAEHLERARPFFKQKHKEFINMFEAKLYAKIKTKDMISRLRRLS